MQKFKEFPYTPATDPTHDYHVANKKYADDKAGSVSSVMSASISNIYSSINQLSTSLEDTYSSVGGLVFLSVENPVRVMGFADNASTSLTINFQSTYFSLALAGANSLSIELRPAGISHTAISDIGTASHASIDAALTSLTAGMTDISSSIADLTASVSTLWEGIGSTSTTVRASASTFTSMTASTLWEGIGSTSTTVRASASTFTSMTASTLWEGIASTSTIVRNSASALVSASVETLRGSVALWIPSVSALVNSEASAMAISVGSSVSNRASAFASATAETVRASLNALSTSVSNYQSAMLTSITTDHLFISTYLSMAGGASINTSDFIRFNVDGSTPLIVSAGQVNFYSPIECISTSLDLNDRGLTASSISISVLRGNSISVSNLYATSISSRFAMLSAAAVGTTSVAGDSFIAAHDTFTDRAVTNVYGLQSWVEISLSAAAVQNNICQGVGGFISPKDLYQRGKIIGLQFAPYAYISGSVGHSNSISAFGIYVNGANIYAGYWAANYSDTAWNSDCVIGMYINSFQNAGEAGHFNVHNAYGLFIDFPNTFGDASGNVSVYTGMYVSMCNNFASTANDAYQVHLAGCSTGTGMFFNISNSTNFARVYQSSPNNLNIAVGPNTSTSSMIKISSSALGFYGQAPMMQATVRSSSAFVTSIKLFDSIFTSTELTTVSLNTRLSTMCNCIATIADRLSSVGIFRSS